MPFVRSLPFLAALVLSAGLWALGASLFLTGPLLPAQNSYGALICSEAIPDKEIVRRLEGQGLSGLISESGQWVLLDSFNALEQVPLDEYRGRLLPFDPRNDPYAEKLRSLFIREENRIVYIPITSAVPMYEKKLALALEDIPYAFEYSGRRSPTILYLVLFGLTACVFFIVRPLRLALRPDAVCLLPCLPALAPLTVGGASGFALASLLAGCAVLLAGPCLERLSLRRRYGGEARQGAYKPLTLQVRQMRRLPVLLPFVLVCAYGLGVWFFDLPLLFMLLVFILFGGVFAFSLRIESGNTKRRVAGGSVMRNKNSGSRSMAGQQTPGHARFSPVPILVRRGFNYAFSWAMIPFAAAALALALALTAGLISGEGPLTPAEGSAPADFTLPPAGTVTEEDYYRHYLFQSTFSLRPLHEPAPSDVSTPPLMSVYEFDPDGLPRQILDGGLAVPDGFASEESPPGGIPPFPLRDLLRYLESRERLTGNGEQGTESRVSKRNR